MGINDLVEFRSVRAGFEPQPFFVDPATVTAIVPSFSMPGCSVIHFANDYVQTVLGDSADVLAALRERPGRGHESAPNEAGMLVTA
jgi:hypothetical protein